MTATSSKSDDITTCFGSTSKFSADSKSNDNDGDEQSTKDIQKVYQIIDNNSLRVCKLNKFLKEKIVELIKKNVMKRAVIDYKFLATEKKMKV